MSIIRRQHPLRQSQQLSKTRNINHFSELTEQLLPLISKEEPLYEYTADEVRGIIDSGDIDRMQEISHYFFTVSGIYKRLIYLFASLPNFDNLVIPHFRSEKASKDKVMNDFNDVMELMDNLDLKMILPTMTLSVFKNGVYYGYFRNDKNPPVIQSLPVAYCRSRFKKDNRYTVEFNLEYFDREFIFAEDRLIALEQFSDEFREKYHQYKSGQFQGMEQQWVLLEPDNTVCFKMPDGVPFFLPIIIDLIELREAKNIEISKDRLDLFQLIVQKLPINKEGELVFGLEEAKELHKNAAGMLKHNENIDVLTTFAEMDVISMRDTRQQVRDNLLKNERAVFNESGVSKNVMATEGNISLKYSLAKDEAIFRFLWPQLNSWLTHVANLTVRGTPKYYFEVWIPPVTIFNEDKMIDRYTKLATYGYAKLLPAVASGMKQNSIINLMKFENDYLELNDRMEPLKSTHTMSPSKEDGKETKEDGRPDAPDEDKDERTLDNEEGETQGGED